MSDSDKLTAAIGVAIAILLILILVLRHIETRRARRPRSP